MPPPKFFVSVSHNFNTYKFVIKKKSVKNGSFVIFIWLGSLETTEVLLVNFNILNNNYQQNSRVIYTFASDKSFGQFRYFMQKFCIFTNIWLRDQNSKPLEIEDKINIASVISYGAKYKTWCTIQST